MIAFFGILLFGSMFAQKVSIPSSVTSDLATRFPGAKVGGWEVSKNGYEAEWKENGMEIAVVYDAKGKYLMTERQIDIKTLPKAVSSAVKINHPGAVIQEAEMQELNNQAIMYQIEVKKAGKLFEYTFALEGTERQGGQEESGDDGSGSGTDGSDEKGHN